MPCRSSFLLCLVLGGCAGEKGGGEDPDGGDPDGGSADGGSADGGSADGGSADGGTALPDGPELWLYLPINLQVTDALPEVEALVDRAAAAGYTGIVLADFKTHLLHTGELADWYGDNVDRFSAHVDAAGLELMPAVLPFGYSEGILRSDPNLAEGQLINTRLTVQGDGSLAPAGDLAGLSNGDFELGGLTGWSWWDHARVSVDSTQAHSGGASVLIAAGGDNARVVQSLSLSDRQQLHLGFWLKAAGFSGSFNAMLYDTTSGQALNHSSYSIASTQDWTRYDLLVNTAEIGSVSLYLGVWGASTGTLWLDDVSLDESAFVNLVRRDGAPLSLADGSGAALVEGRDVDVVVDPLAGPDGIFDDWHEPPSIASSLSPGSQVSASYYAVTPVYGYQVGACLTEPSGHSWMEDNLGAVAAAYPGSTAFFPQYDEMRHLYSCAGCQATGEDAGGLLAWHVAQSTALIEAERPGARIYLWSDMFDPNHNAVDGYYFVEGDLSGSWEGLPEGVVIMNWYRTAASIDWFESLGVQQILAGYYDSGDGAAAAASDLAAAGDSAGIRGAMYTTWSDDYSQLEAYGEAMLAGLSER